jgi:hypothetical protein
MWRCVDLVWTDISEERRFTEDLHGSISQKTAFFKSKNIHDNTCGVQTRTTTKVELLDPLHYVARELLWRAYCVVASKFRKYKEKSEVQKCTDRT